MDPTPEKSLSPDWFRNEVPVSGPGCASSEAIVFFRAPVGTFAGVTITSNPRADAGGEAI